MASADRRLREVFVELADTLVADFDITDYLGRLTARCVELLGVDACGAVLANPRGAVTLVAGSTEPVRRAESAELDTASGPGLDAFRTGQAIAHKNLTEGATPWARFAAAAVTAGCVAVHALPMRLRDDTIGAVNLYNATEGPFDAETVAVGRSLADAATIGILHQRSVAQHEIRTGQLQTALNSRVAIEQAKGYLSQRLGVTMQDAFHLLRKHARSHNRRLNEVAADVVTGELDLAPQHGPSTAP